MSEDDEPVESSSGIVAVHFRLLRGLGKQVRARTLGPADRETLWGMLCDGAGVEAVPLADVEREWRAFVGGIHKRSAIAMNGDTDPEFVVVGILFERKLVAGHTARTEPLLAALLRIWSKSFPDRESYLHAARRLSSRAVDRPPRRGGESS